MSTRLHSLFCFLALLGSLLMPPVFAAGQSTPESREPGDQLVPFEGPGLDGKPVRLADLKGKVVLIDFWATWCGPCLREFPALKEVYAKRHAAGFEILGVSLDDDQADVTRFLAKTPLPWKHIVEGKGWDSPIGRSFAIRAIPATLLLDRELRVVAVNKRGAALEAHIAKLFGEESDFFRGEELFEQTTKAIDDQNWMEAEQTFGKLREIEALEVQWFRVMGYAAALQADGGRIAELAADELISRAPTDSFGYHLRAKALFLQNDKPGAIAAAQDANQIQFQFETLQLLCTTLANIAKPGDAWKALADNTDNLEFDEKTRMLYTALDAATGSFQSDDRKKAVAWYDAAKRIDDTKVNINELIRGQSVPDIEGPLFGGGTIRLSEYRGKVTFVDFWATWCGPCLAELPNLKAAHAKFSGHGFHILGVSLDHDEKALANYLEKDPLPWKHLIEGKGWDSKAAALYTVTGIPATMLLDENLQVIGTNLRGDALDDALTRHFGLPRESEEAVAELRHFANPARDIDLAAVAQALSKVTLSFKSQISRDPELAASLAWSSHALSALWAPEDFRFEAQLIDSATRWAFYADREQVADDRTTALIIRTIQSLEQGKPVADRLYLERVSYAYTTAAKILDKVGRPDLARASAMRSVAAGQAIGQNFQHLGGNTKTLEALGGTAPPFPDPDGDISAYLDKVAPAPDYAAVLKTLNWDAIRQVDPQAIRLLVETHAELSHVALFDDLLHQAPTLYAQALLASRPDAQPNTRNLLRAIELFARGETAQRAGTVSPLVLLAAADAAALSLDEGEADRAVRVLASTGEWAHDLRMLRLPPVAIEAARLLAHPQANPTAPQRAQLAFLAAYHGRLLMEPAQRELLGRWTYAALQNADYETERPANKSSMFFTLMVDMQDDGIDLTTGPQGAAEFPRQVLAGLLASGAQPNPQDAAPRLRRSAGALATAVRTSYWRNIGWASPALTQLRLLTENPQVDTPANRVIAYTEVADEIKTRALPSATLELFAAAVATETAEIDNRYSARLANVVASQLTRNGMASAHTLSMIEKALTWARKSKHPYWRVLTDECMFLETIARTYEAIGEAQHARAAMARAYPLAQVTSPAYIDDFGKYLAALGGEPKKSQSDVLMPRRSPYSLPVGDQLVHLQNAPTFEPPTLKVEASPLPPVSNKALLDAISATWLNGLPHPADPLVGSDGWWMKNFDLRPISPGAVRRAKPTQVRILCLAAEPSGGKTLSISGSHADLGDWKPNTIAGEVLLKGQGFAVYQFKTAFDPSIRFKHCYGTPNADWPGTDEWAQGDNRDFLGFGSRTYQDPNGTPVIVTHFGSWNR